MLELLTPDVVERFWGRVGVVDGDDTCWPWISASPTERYGKFCLPGFRQAFDAHRVAWVIQNGCEIPDGLWILHKCDNRPCCRGSHLYAGTRADNTADAVARGRMAHLTWAQSMFTKTEATELQRLVLAGSSQRELGLVFGVSHRTIGRAIRRLVA